MNTDEALTILQLFHAGLLAETVRQCDKHGILNEVTEEMLREDRHSARARLKQFEIASPDELFVRHKEIFGFSDWSVAVSDSEIRITNTSCKVCAIAQATGTAQPCYLCCVNPFTALCKAMDPEYSITVRETLWSSSRCTFIIRQINKTKKETL